MTRPYHHGTLRSALLDEALRMLVSDGVEAITLRELARRAGVSHGAPQRHFADRQALLDALAARGFGMLTATLRTAVDGHPEGSRAGLRAGLEAWVRFASEKGALLDLMFRTKMTDASETTRAAAFDLFALGARLTGEPPGGGSVGPLRYVLAGMVEGIGSLVASGRLPEAELPRVIDCAVELVEPALPKP